MFRGYFRGRDYTRCTAYYLTSPPTKTTQMLPNVDIETPYIECLGQYPPWNQEITQRNSNHIFSQGGGFKYFSFSLPHWVNDSTGWFNYHVAVIWFAPKFRPLTWNALGSPRQKKTIILKFLGYGGYLWILWGMHLPKNDPMEIKRDLEDGRWCVSVFSFRNWVQLLAGFIATVPPIIIEVEKRSLQY